MADAIELVRIKLGNEERVGGWDGESARCGCRAALTAGEVTLVVEAGRDTPTLGEPGDEAFRTRVLLATDEADGLRTVVPRMREKGDPTSIAVMKSRTVVAMVATST